MLVDHHLCAEEKINDNRTKWSPTQSQYTVIIRVINTILFCGKYDHRPNQTKFCYSVIDLLACIFFPDCSPGNLHLVIINYAKSYTYVCGCTYLRQHLKRTVLWGTIHMVQNEKTYKLKRSINHNKICNIAQVFFELK